jgi:flagellar hook-length control protein FliK
VNLPSILSTIASSPQIDLNQIDNSQSSNSGMSFDQQLTAQTEKLNQQASTIQTSESKSADSEQAQSQDAQLVAKSANDSDDKNTDNSEIVEAIAGMAVAPSLLGGINLAVKVIDRLTSSDQATQTENISTASGVSGITKSSMTDSANTAINTIATLSSSEANSMLNAADIAKTSTQDISTSLSEQKAAMDAKALNAATQDSLNQASKMNTTVFSPENISSELKSEIDLRNALIQDARNSANSKTNNNNDNLLTGNLVDLENQLTELKSNNSLKVSNAVNAAAISQRVLASDLASDTTNKDISINNINANQRTTQLDSVNLVELKAPVSSPDWGPALNQRVTWMVANSLQNASITVNPPNLGPLEINIQTDQNKTNVQFIVSSSEVRQAIQDAIPALSKMLENSGLQLGQADINSRSHSQNRENAKTETQIKNIEAISNQVESASIQGQGLINTYV